MEKKEQKSEAGVPQPRSMLRILPERRPLKRF
jgi:hypothetical protein